MDEVFFITICCAPRHKNQLAHPAIWAAILETIKLRQQRKQLTARLVLAMPDHLHGLFSFTGNKPMNTVITSIKSWLAKTRQIQWQRDFFDHRLRSWESSVEKANYIRMNPVRAALVKDPAEWPYVHPR